MRGRGGRYRTLVPRDPDSQDVSVLPPGAPWLQLRAPRAPGSTREVRARMAGLPAHTGGGA